jgi:hypothetical protein
MAEPNIALTLSPELIKPIVEAKISVAIAEALKDQGTLIEKCVAYAMNMKVSSSGRVSSSSYENNHRFLDIIVNNALQDAARKALATWLEENMDAFQAAFIKSLKADKNAVVKAMMTGFKDSLSSNYSFNVCCSFQTPKDR